MPSNLSPTEKLNPIRKGPGGAVIVDGEARHTNFFNSAINGPNVMYLYVEDSYARDGVHFSARGDLANQPAMMQDKVNGGLKRATYKDAVTNDTIRQAAKDAGTEIVVSFVNRDRKPQSYSVEQIMELTGAKIVVAPEPGKRVHLPFDTNKDDPNYLRETGDALTPGTKYKQEMATGQYSRLHKWYKDPTTGKITDGGIWTEQQKFNDGVSDPEVNKTPKQQHDDVQRIMNSPLSEADKQAMLRARPKGVAETKKPGGEIEGNVGDPVKVTDLVPALGKAPAPKPAEKQPDKIEVPRKKAMLNLKDIQMGGKGDGTGIGGINV